jgi:acetyltransferase-like isoleucine patch superfamily enzyme
VVRVSCLPPDAYRVKIVTVAGRITGQDPDTLERPPANSPNQWLVPYVKGPIWCDYGTGVRIGRTTFINRGCKILDTTVSRIVIGDDCSIGPDVSIYGVSHPKDRRILRGPLAIPSTASDVIIGDNCWIGGGATILYVAPFPVGVPTWRVPFADIPMTGQG